MVRRTCLDVHQVLYLIICPLKVILGREGILVCIISTQRKMKFLNIENKFPFPTGGLMVVQLFGCLFI